MKAVRVYDYGGGKKQLVYEDVPQPRPRDDEVLVRVYAAGVTPVELTWPGTARIEPGTNQSMPIIPGHEMSGIVEEIGTRVIGVKTGDAVYGLTEFARDGCQAEYVIARTSEIAPKPSSIDYIQAAAAPLSALTVWQALFDYAHLLGGQSVLIHGAAGRVGIFAVQLARWTGARVIGTASKTDMNFLFKLGANDVIDYKTTRFENVVHDVDVVLDTVGGEILERSWDVSRKGGTLVSVSSNIQTPEGLSLPAYIQQKGEMHGVRAVWFIVEPKRDQLVQIGELIDAGHLVPIVDTVLPLSDVHQAYVDKRDPNRHGKTVLRIGS
jgi:NADPH:quinone reductase-like Zn-dependent oxidoreductase